MEKSLVKPKHIKTILLWMKKRNKLIAASVAFLFFCITLTVVLIETYHEYVTPSEESEYLTTVPKIEFKDIIGEVESNYCYLKTASQTDCIVQCNDILVGNVSINVHKLNFTTCYVMGIKLILVEVYFPNNKVTKGWLQNLSKDVIELEVTSTLLFELGESAFSGKPFEYLQTLVIVKSSVKYLRKDTFKNSKIQTFNFRYTMNRQIEVEFNALEYISDYLTVLQFNQCIDDSLAIKNMTGTSDSTFNQLQEIDLSYNTFTNIQNYSFTDTPKLRSLYLMNNNIKTIDVSAFEGIGASIQLLNLKGNKLKTLPNGVFRGFTRTEDGARIDIEDNPWECNCDLFWLKEFYIKKLLIYFQNGSIPFNCTVGDYLEVEFCSNKITTTTISTSTVTPGTTLSSSSTSSTTTQRITTENPENFVYLICTNSQDVSQEAFDRIFSHTVTVRNASITYNFYQIKSTANFEIKLMNNVGTDYLIWINSKNSSDYGCVNNIKETVELTNLNYGMTYTICLLKESEETVAPFDCTSLTVPLEWRNNAWILNKHMLIVIGGALSVTLAIILVTATIMFYTIRQNPKLIRGNKRVVIVRNKSADALVMPNYEKQRYVPPSIYTNSEGYLTPRHKLYEKINERRIRPLNTITEKFYQDFHETMPRHSRNSYTGFLHRRSVGSEVYEAPPLPPNHPSDKPCSSRQSSIYKH